MASKDTNIIKQGTADKRKYVTIMIPQKLEITGMLESGKSQSVDMASHNTGSLTRYDITKQKDHYDYLWHKFKCDEPFEVTRHGNSLY
jgi:hypothetical protein